MVVCLPVILFFGLLFVLAFPWNICTQILASAYFPQLLHNIYSLYNILFFSLVIQFNNSLELEVSPVNQMKESESSSLVVLTTIQEVSFPGHNHYDS